MEYCSFPQWRAMVATPSLVSGQTEDGLLTG